MSRPGAGVFQMNSSPWARTGAGRAGRPPRRCRGRPAPKRRLLHQRVSRRRISHSSRTEIDSDSGSDGLQVPLIFRWTRYHGVFLAYCVLHIGNTPSKQLHGTNESNYNCNSPCMGSWSECAKQVVMGYSIGAPIARRCDPCFPIPPLTAKGGATGNIPKGQSPAALPQWCTRAPHGSLSASAARVVRPRLHGQSIQGVATLKVDCSRLFFPYVWPAVHLSGGPTIPQQSRSHDTSSPNRNWGRLKGDPTAPRVLGVFPNGTVPEFHTLGWNFARQFRVPAIPRRRHRVTWGPAGCAVPLVVGRARFGLPCECAAGISRSP